MGTSVDENFCLKWNDFESNVAASFRELRANTDLFDVTLACDGAEPGSWRTVRAHKLVLSACSGFFKQMLRHPSCSSPAAIGSGSSVVYLRGVRGFDLDAVLGKGSKRTPII